MTGHERNRITQMTFAVSDLERISDHAINIAEYALQLKQKKTALSDKAMGEIKTLSQSVTSAVDFCIDIFESDDFDKLDEAEKTRTSRRRTRKETPQQSHRPTLRPSMRPARRRHLHQYC